MAEQRVEAEVAALVEELDADYRERRQARSRVLRVRVSGAGPRR